MFYRERLTVAWWAWPVGVGCATVLAAELGIGATELRSPVTYVVAGGLAVVGLASLGRIRIKVSKGELTVDDARLPLTVIASARVIEGAERRDLLGVEADPLAFVIQRPWIDGGVRIDLNDPEDPTPYWFVSSRHPTELAAALTVGSAGGAAGPAGGV